MMYCSMCEGINSEAISEVILHFDFIHIVIILSVFLTIVELNMLSLGLYFKANKNYIITVIFEGDIQTFLYIFSIVIFFFRKLYNIVQVLKNIWNYKVYKP